MLVKWRSLPKGELGELVPRKSGATVILGVRLVALYYKAAAEE